jgi:mRNA-degrading endonuclease toxin of MazEF toxin-antitoxin module
MRRAEVVRLRRRIGFAADGRPELLLVVQADGIPRRPTVLVVPLDPRAAIHRKDPSAIPVPGAELGVRDEHAALTTSVQAVLADRLDPGRIAVVSAQTMAQVDAALGIVLGLV